MKKLSVLTIIISCFFTFLKAKSISINPGTNTLRNFTSLTGSEAIQPNVVTNFQVTCSRNRFTITWTTQSEINNRRFLLYKSNNGVKFDLVATVPSIAPGGNSAIRLPYIYPDNGIPGTQVFYRLVSEDRDGQVRDWGIVTPSCGTIGTGFSLHPNPATDQSILTMNGVKELMNIHIYNGMGQSVYQNRANGTVYLPAGKWAPGIYHITVTDSRNEIVYHDKLVVQ